MVSHFAEVPKLFMGHTVFFDKSKGEGSLTQCCIKTKFVWNVKAGTIVDWNPLLCANDGNNQITKTTLCIKWKNGTDGDFFLYFYVSTSSDAFHWVFI